MIIPFDPQKKQYDVSTLLSQLNKSRNLQCSLVDFTAELLEQYLTGKISTAEFCETYTSKTKKAQYLLSMMPSEEIRTNKIVFQKEFAFADTLTDVVLEVNAADEAAFRNDLCGCIKKYLLSLK